MKKISSLVMISIATLLLISCSKKEMDHHNMEMGNTKIVVKDNIQIAFDLYDGPGYKMMMKMMDMEVNKDRKIDHYISISLMNKADKSIVKNARISLTVINPENKSGKKIANSMSGGTMFHYGASFNMKIKGEYKVKAEIKIDNKDYTAETSFKI